MGNKRKNERSGGDRRAKRAKSNIGAATNTKEKETPRGTSWTPAADPSRPSLKADGQPSAQRRARIRRLAPPRPFPTVSSASSATGPRSAHHEGKGDICVTRKTKLAAYLRRCKALLVEDGLNELRLSAMGAAIPHLALLAVSLPQILPWAEDEVHVDVFTGSLHVHDEVLSESGSGADDGGQEEFRTRVKSTMSVLIHIGQGDGSTAADNGVRGRVSCTADEDEREANGSMGGVERADVPERIVLQEPEQDDTGTLLTCY